MQESDLHNLIIRRLTLALSPAEEILFKERMESDPEAKDTYEQYRNLWESSRKLPLRSGLSFEDRWSKFQQRVEREVPERSRLPYRVIFRYAAVVTAIISIASYFLFQSSEPVKVSTGFGESKSIILPDNSTVMVNSGTTLEYDASSWNKERVLHIVGEAYFDVKRAGTPFVVIASNATVKVLGTTFNVRSRDEITSIICVTGKVAVKRKNTSDEGLILTKGIGVTVNKEIISEAYEVEAEDEISWLKGDFYFKDTPLRDVFSEFERRFKKTIVLKKNVGNRAFTGRFKRPQLTKAIETVCLTAGLNYSMAADSTIFIE